MQIIGIIPARSGSKGVLNKNIKSLAGYPLIAYSIRAALQCRSISRVMVSTDSERYADIAREYGAEVPFLRPSEISADLSTDLDFFKHTVEWMLRHEGKAPDLFVHLRPTTPFRDPILVENAIQLMQSSEGATALRSLHEMSESAYKAFEISGPWLKSVGTGSMSLDASNDARQRYPRTYHANGYVDVVRSSLILNEGKLHGDRVVAFITPPVVEVDTIEDFHYLEYQADRNPGWLERLSPGEIHGRTV
jgi:N-acylneuraminate cytidylyltransferase